MTEIELTSQRRRTIMDEVRETAQKEFTEFIASAVDLIKAGCRHKAFINDLAKKHQGFDILTPLTDGGPNDKEWSRLLRGRRIATDRYIAAEKKLEHSLHRLLGKHGLQTRIDVADLMKRVRMTQKEEREGLLPEGARIMKQLKEEAYAEARDTCNRKD